jgi:tetratricopeptide (TPR) repeat protein
VRRAAYESLGGYFPGNRFLELDIRATDLSDVSMDRALFLYDSLRFMLPRSPQAYQAMSRIAEIQLTMLDDYDAAIRGFDQVLEEAPQRQLQLYSGIRLVDAWLSKGDTTRARKELQRTLELTGVDTDEPMVAYSRAKVDLHRGDLAALQTELLNLSGSAGPGDPLFNDALELLAIMEGNGGVDNSQLEAYFRAERLVGQHKLSQATQDLLAIKGNSKTIADEAHARAIQLLRHLGKQADAQAAMEQFLKTYSDSQWRPQVLTWLGELYQYDYGDPMGAVAYYEAVVVEYPTFLHMQDVRLRLRAIIGGDS